MSLTATPVLTPGQGISHRLRLVFVAEFLELLSPACLGILYQRTCVGLRYGIHVSLNEIFLESKTISLAITFRLRLPYFSIKRNNGFTSYHYFKAWRPTNQPRDQFSFVIPLSLNRYTHVTEYKPFIHRATPPIGASP